jgi:hypothetical protein
MTSIQKPELKLSMQEIVRIYQSIEDNLNCRNLVIRSDYIKLHRKIFDFMHAYDLLEETYGDTFNKETIQVHIS